MMMAFYTRAETCRSKTVQRFEKLPRLTTATLAAVYLHRKAMSHLKKIIFFPVIVVQPAKKFPPFMKTDILLPFVK